MSNKLNKFKLYTNYKKLALWVILVGIVLIIVFTRVLLTNSSETKVALSLEYYKNYTKGVILSPKEFLKTYDLKVEGNPKKSTVVVPKNWNIVLGEYPEGLYWKLVNVFSNDVGLDLNGLKGIKVEVWKYSLKNGLGKLKGEVGFRYPSNTILLIKGNKVVGAWLAFNINGIGPSVKQNNISDITGLDYEDWVQKEGIFSNSEKNKDLESLGPVDVLKVYFKAIEAGDKIRAHACESPIVMQNVLTRNLSGRHLYNTGYSRDNSIVDNIIKAKPISFKLIDHSMAEIVELGNMTEIQVEIQMELKWKTSQYNTRDGKAFRFALLKKYNNGWKLSELGTGP